MLPALTLLWIRPPLSFFCSCLPSKPKSSSLSEWTAGRREKKVSPGGMKKCAEQNVMDPWLQDQGLGRPVCQQQENSNNTSSRTARGAGVASFPPKCLQQAGLWCHFAHEKNGGSGKSLIFPWDCWGAIRFGESGKSKCEVRKEFLQARRVAGSDGCLQAAESKEEQRDKGSSLNCCSAWGTSPANSLSHCHLVSGVHLDLHGVGTESLLPQDYGEPQSTAWSAIVF